MTTDSERLYFLAKFGRAIRRADNGHRNLLVWTEDFPAEDNSLLDNLRAAIDRQIAEKNNDQEPI